MPVKGEFFNNPGGAGGFYDYQIQHSCRFDSDTPSYLSRTQGTPTNVDKMTISAWVKRSFLGGAMYAFTGSGKSGGGGQYSHIGFGGDGNDPDHFFWLQNPGSVSINLESAALFRDNTGWYHVVLSNDSTQSTDTNRNKIYINGTQLTSWQTSYASYFYSTLNSDFLMNSSSHTFFVGSGGDSGGSAYKPFDGYIADYVFIDGTQVDISNFGETKNGVWIPKDPSGLTFGNNGVHLKFEDASNLGNDSSGNNNDLTSSGLGTDHQVLDSPTFGS